MAVQGADFPSDPSGVTIFAVGTDGKVYPLVIDQSSGAALVKISSGDQAPVVTGQTSAAAAAGLSDRDINLLRLVELRVHSRLLAMGLNVADDIDAMRADEMASFGP